MDNPGTVILFCLLQLTLLVLGAEAGRMRCYNCTYVEYKKKETWGGLEECQAEEFDEAKVPVVTCDGTCLTRSVWGDVVVTQRACLRRGEGPCHRVDRFPMGDDGYVSQTCCKDSRCNNPDNDSALSVLHSATARRTLASLATASALLRWLGLA